MGVSTDGGQRNASPTLQNDGGKKRGHWNRHEATSGQLWDGSRIGMVRAGRDGMQVVGSGMDGKVWPGEGGGNNGGANVV